VDLGSNSFHLVVARVVEGHLDVVDRLRERVALAEGLREDGRIDAPVAERAIRALARIGQRLRDVPRSGVRAVGTHAFRRAKDPPFLARAERALGHPIEVVAGPEEARLVYQGVAHTTSAPPGRRLVVDIGGGSTECIVGEGLDPVRTDSLEMGCVSFSERFFPDGRVGAKAMARARLAALLELRPIRRTYRRLRWRSATGSSGTILAVAEVLSRWGDPGITRAGVARLATAVVDAGHVSRAALPGLSPDRAPVLPGGIAILGAVMDALRVRRLAVSAGALREGLLHDLLGRIRDEDVRDRAVRRLAARHHVDGAQALRVERTARRLLAEVARAWDLEAPDAARLLSWAAQVHEIGLAVAYSGHHRHGAYLAAHSEMPGFSRDLQRELSSLVLAHRRRLRREAFEGVPARDVPRLVRLSALLRLAVLLHRARSPRPPPPVVLDAAGTTLRVRFPRGWLERHPLTRAGLEEEREALRGLVRLVAS
jgi:exopolyphosphatase/guanosine-5'-triphosphate,3'-diphosphate pyrophosphatase